MQPSLFSGPSSLRHPTERIAFWLTAACALPAALVIGFVLHESIGASQVALFIVIAMVYVTLARGKLLGSSVRIHETQYPRVFAIVKRTCAALEIPMPLIFVREDNLVPVAALGFGEPYSLVISSHWIEAFEDDELAFMIGRELGHIAAGHARFLSLLSVNGNENPIIALIFGAWLRRCTFTCDKVGLLCCGSIDAAIRAMGVASFHHFGRKIDYEAFAEQRSEIATDPVLRWGAWLGSEPYATLRIASLRQFIASQTYLSAEEWFLRERGEEPPALPEPGTTKVVKKDCAGWWRRATAYAIDAIVVSAILGSFGYNLNPIHVNGRDAGATPPPSPNLHRVSVNGNSVSLDGKTIVTFDSPGPSASPGATTRSGRRHYWVNPLAAYVPSAAPSGAAAALPGASPSATPEEEDIGPFAFTDDGMQIREGKHLVPFAPDRIFGAVIASMVTWGPGFWLPIYLAILVSIAGQSFGMMIAGLRVVTTDFHRPGIIRTIIRYGLVLFPPTIVLIMLMSFIWRRVLLHDYLTKTRVVKVERILVRVAGDPTS